MEEGERRWNKAVEEADSMLHGNKVREASYYPFVKKTKLNYYYYYSYYLTSDNSWPKCIQTKNITVIPGTGGDRSCLRILHEGQVSLKLILENNR